MRARLARRAARLSAGLLLAWLSGTGAAAWVATHRREAPFDEPAPRGLAVEAHRLGTEDGEELGAWYLPGPPEQPAVILFHGLGDSRSGQRHLVAHLARRGLTVLAVTLRAHGDSTGDDLDFGWSSRADVRSAVEFLERRRPGRPILVAGFSLGSAAALLAAPDLGDRVAGYWLESPYVDLPTAVRNRTELFLPPVADDLAYAGLLLWSRLVLPVEPERISPLEAIGAVPARIPVWILNGTADPRTRPADVERLHERRRRSPAATARLVLFDGAEHQSLFHYDRARWETEFDAWLALARSTSSASPAN